MAHLLLAVLRERELLEELKVASEVRIIQAAMAPAVRGIRSDLSEANIQSAEDVNSKCVNCTIPSILEVILHSTKSQRLRSKLTRRSLVFQVFAFRR
ncbi:unnamed protein product [Sphagnum jensenii]|uniref:Uncharacterized protein n=1 Tax=Sphagnum jensenii TaxID=128206 RepID=A0ABP1BNQ0_9BRYO